MAGLILGSMSVTWALSGIFGGLLMVSTSHRLVAIKERLKLARAMRSTCQSPLNVSVWPRRPLPDTQASRRPGHVHRA